MTEGPFTVVIWCKAEVHPVNVNGECTGPVHRDDFCFHQNVLSDEAAKEWLNKFKERSHDNSVGC